MLPYRDSRLIRFALLGFFLIVVGYAYFEGRAILYGPSIAVADRVIETSEHAITIKGTASHITSLSMNGMAIPVTENGSFSELYALAPGYNRITLDARDQFGKTTERIIEAVYTPPATPTTSTASSTPAVAH